MSNAFLMYFDKLVIAPIFGYAILGYYQLGFQFLLFLGMIPISFYQYLLPEESRGSKKTNVRLFGFLLSVCLTIAFFLMSPLIIQTFFPNFITSIDVVRIMSIGIIPMMMVWILNSKFLSSGRSKYVLTGAAIYVTSQMVLIMYLGSTMGVIGLALAVIFALMAQATFLYVSNKRLKINF